MSTKNFYGNRKVVRAIYYKPESVFEIPDGLDLEDKSVVSEWYVKYDILHIHYADGRRKETEPLMPWSATYDYDNYECPVKTELLSVEEEYGMDCIYEDEDIKYVTSFKIAINKVKRSKIYNYGLGLKLNIRDAGIT